MSSCSYYHNGVFSDVVKVSRLSSVEFHEQTRKSRIPTGSTLSYHHCTTNRLIRIVSDVNFSPYTLIYNYVLLLHLYTILPSLAVNVSYNYFAGKTILLKK